MKRFFSLLLIAATVLMMAACGGKSGKKAESGQEDVVAQSTEEVAESAEAVAEPAVAEEPAVESKKWYEGDFSLTETMYIAGNGLTRIYARKGDVIIATSEGSPTTNLLVFTDSTRTQYLVGNAKKSYALTGEKKISGKEEAIYLYLKSQLGEDIFAKKDITKGAEGAAMRDTTLFGRPAWIITVEKTEKVLSVEAYGKSIVYVDKENGLVYYKYGYMRSGDQVITDGKVMEVTEFSTEPTYEGLITSLDGLTSIN